MTRSPVQLHIRNMKRDGRDAKKARIRLRLSQKQFAEMCGIAPETLCRIEKPGRDVPGPIDGILLLLERDETAIRFLMEKRGVGVA